MSDTILNQLRDLIQDDIGVRGLRTDPTHNLVNACPDDFRQAYVYENDELPLVTLTHEHIKETTPAWTFAEAKARFDAGMPDWSVPDDKKQFQFDLDNAVTGNGRPRTGKSLGKREENKETVRRAKDHSAIKRGIERPLSLEGPFGPAPSTNPSLPDKEFESAAFSYDDAPLMTIVNRTTGEKLL